MTTHTWTTHDSPFGPLTLVGGPAGLSELRFAGHATPPGDGDATRFAEVARQLDEYFTGARARFDVALDLDGTPFQRAVWQRVTEIPCGSTTTYAELARSVARPDAVRAVAAAIGRTPVPIIVPCHRVLGSDGSLTGYRGGLERKQALLDLERGVLARS